MSEVKRFSLVKPGLDTPFHVDFDWWQSNDRNWRVYLRSLLCAEHQETFAEMSDEQQIDWIDPKTAEVRPMDGIQHILMAHCTRQPDFIEAHTALVEAIFRTFLVNGNSPMTPADLAERLQRPAQIILKTIAGPRVYRGLRPFVNSLTM
jgi:hypothetical protein